MVFLHDASLAHTLVSKVLPLADAVSARGRDANDPVAAAVARRHEQRTVGHRGDGAEASVLLIEEDLALRRMCVLQAEPPEVLLLERRHDKRVGPGTPPRTGEEIRPGDGERRRA